MALYEVWTQDHRLGFINDKAEIVGTATEALVAAWDKLKRTGVTVTEGEAPPADAPGGQTGVEYEVTYPVKAAVGAALRELEYEYGWEVGEVFAEFLV